MSNRNMKKWLADYTAAPVKKPFPILTFPSAEPLGLSVKDLLSTVENQVAGIEWIARHTDSAAAVSFMDLSVEAETFGAEVRFSENEVPTIVGSIVCDEEGANALAVPPVGAGRTGICIEAVKRAKELVTDRPFFAGMIGPFSLAARLFGVNEVMYECYDEPEALHTVLEKASSFLIGYAKAYRAAGADGILLAEPVSGLLSPALEAEFSAPYVKRIFDTIREDEFLWIYHNCGPNTPLMIPSLLSFGADVYHFGDAVSMTDILSKMPENIAVGGNISPAGEFAGGTPESMTKAVNELLTACAGYPNYIPSSGCDIPPTAKWENINAFFAATEQFYRKKG